MEKCEGEFGIVDVVETDDDADIFNLSRTLDEIMDEREM
jgi:hypothetical protein